jgi:hypothetical protein
MTSPADYQACVAADVRRPHKPLRKWLAEQERKLDQGQRLARPSEMRVRDVPAVADVRREQIWDVNPLGDFGP